jgi:hypothetical protein
MLCGDIEYFEKLAKELVAKDRLPPVCLPVHFFAKRDTFRQWGKCQRHLPAKKPT